MERRTTLIALTLGAAACGGSGDASSQDPALTSAPVTSFTPPSPRGCAAAASAYDYCFAFRGGTPLAIRVDLALATPPHAKGAVRFQRVDGSPAAVLDDVEFGLPASKRDHVFYFEIYPGTYTVDVAVAGEAGSTLPLVIAEDPVETWLSLE